MKTIILPWTTVATDSTTEVFIPATGWMEAAEAAKLRTSFEARAFNGGINVLVGYQTANAENVPDAHQGTGSFQTTGGYYQGSSFTDVSSNTQAKRLVRFGWVVKLTSGSSLATVRVGGSIDIIRPG